MTKQLHMKEADILKEYNEAKDKREQVRILAELNLTSQEHIVEVLRAQGVDGRAFQWLHPAKKKKPATVEVKAELPTEAQKAPRVKPRIIHDFNRMAELFQAIHEDIMAGKTPPTDWVNEFDELWLSIVEKLSGDEK